MRHYLKALITTGVAFYLGYSLIPTMYLGSDPENLLIIIGGLFIISQAVKPLFTIVLLPINILTFGLLSFALNIAFLFALTYLLPGFKIEAYNFPGANVNGVLIPATHLSQIATITVIGVTITLTQKILHFVFD